MIHWWEQTLPVSDPDYKCMNCDEIGTTELIGLDSERKRIWICCSCSNCLFENNDFMFPLPKEMRK